MAAAVLRLRQVGDVERHGFAVARLRHRRLDRRVGLFFRRRRLRHRTDLAGDLGEGLIGQIIHLRRQLMELLAREVARLGHDVGELTDHVAALDAERAHHQLQLAFWMLDGAADDHLRGRLAHVARRHQLRALLEHARNHRLRLIRVQSRERDYRQRCLRAGRRRRHLREAGRSIHERTRHQRRSQTSHASTISRPSGICRCKKRRA